MNNKPRLKENEFKEYLELMKMIKELWKERGYFYSFNFSYFRVFKTKELIYSLYIYRKLGDKKYNRPKKIYKNYPEMKIAINEFMKATSIELKKELLLNTDPDKLKDLMNS